MDGYVAPKRRIFRFAFLLASINSSSASAKLLEEMGQAQECGAFRHCLSRSKARSICWFNSATVIVRMKNSFLCLYSGAPRSASHTVYPPHRSSSRERLCKVDNTNKQPPTTTVLFP